MWCSALFARNNRYKFEDSNAAVWFLKYRLFIQFMFMEMSYAFLTSKIIHRFDVLWLNFVWTKNHVVSDFKKWSEMQKKKQWGWWQKRTHLPACCSSRSFVLYTTFTPLQHQEYKSTQISAGTTRAENRNALRMSPTGIDSRTPATLGLAALPSTKSRNCATPTTLW